MLLNLSCAVLQKVPVLFLYGKGGFYDVCV